MEECIQPMYVSLFLRLQVCKFCRRANKKIWFKSSMVGHLGDGNFHVLLPFDPEDKEMYKKIRKFNDPLIKNP